MLSLVSPNVSLRFSKQNTTPFSDIRIRVEHARAIGLRGFSFSGKYFPSYVRTLIIFNMILSSVMVPVSSTVIPLPVYKVGYGLGFVSKDKKTPSSFKPEGSTKLITRKYTTNASSENLRIGSWNLVCAIDSFPLLVFNFLFSFRIRKLLAGASGARIKHEPSKDESFSFLLFFLL